MEHVLSLSYGKDSMACLFAIEELGWELDRIVHAEVWATDTVPADFPEMVEFKKKADAIIKRRWGIEVEHYSSGATFDSAFHRIRGATGGRTKNPGKNYGWPLTIASSWCVHVLKVEAIKKIGTGDCIQYIGIAADEPKRFHNFNNKVISPLVELGWTEADCFKKCEENGLLSPIYTSSTRGGCWFCPKQNLQSLRRLRKEHPDLWQMMLAWDKESDVPYKANGHTVHDYDARFLAEEQGLVPTDKRFRWKMLKDIEPNKEDKNL